MFACVFVYACVACVVCVHACCVSLRGSVCVVYITCHVCMYVYVCVGLFCADCPVMCGVKSVDLQVVPDGNSTHSAGKHNCNSITSPTNSNRSAPYTHLYRLLASLHVSNRIHMK